MHQAALRQPLQPRPQQSLEVLATGARVQEQWEVELDRQVELRLEVLELRLLGRQEESVVVEPDLAERDAVPAIAARDREGT